MRQIDTPSSILDTQENVTNENIQCKLSNTLYSRQITLDTVFIQYKHMITDSDNQTIQITKQTIYTSRKIIGVVSHFFKYF